MNADTPRNYYDEESGGALSKFIFKPIENTYEWMFGIGHDVDTSIQVDEIRTLIRYAAENDIDPPEPNPSEPTKSIIVLLKSALQRLGICRAKGYDDKSEYLEAVGELESEILFYYARLAKETISWVVSKVLVSKIDSKTFRGLGLGCVKGNAYFS